MRDEFGQNPENKLNQSLKIILFHKQTYFTTYNFEDQGLK